MLQFEKYRTRGDELTDDFFNRRWRDVDLRLHAVEEAVDNLDEARDKLVELGLVELSNQIDSEIESLQELINGAEADLTETQNEIDDLNSQLAALDAAFDAIIAGGSLPAASVSVASIPGLAASDAQAAFAELQGDVEANTALINSLQLGAVVVPNVAARNALTGLNKGAIVFVQDDGAAKWAHYQVTSDGDGTWGGVSKQLVASQDTCVLKTGDTITGLLQFSAQTKAVRVNQWADLSAGNDGRAVLASNLYAHWNGTAVEYRAAQTHLTMGYAAIRMSTNGLQFGGATGATTADAVVTPTWYNIWHAGNFDPTTKASVAGGDFTGDVAINKTAGNGRHMQFKSATVLRWAHGANSVAEGGANAGSNYVIRRYDDSGALIADAVTITRSNGNALFEAQVKAASFDTTSDRRLKTHIKDFALKQCRKVLELCPVAFRFKGKKTTEIGLIAQDVAESLPQAVHTGEDGMLAINYGAVVAALLGVIKDQDARIARLEAALAR